MVNYDRDDTDSEPASIDDVLDDDRPASDGGTTAESVFTTVSDVEVTWWDRLKNFLRGYVYAPLTIMWHDWRARIGGAITMGYVLIAIFGQVVFPPPQVNQAPVGVSWFDPSYTRYVFGIPEFTVGSWTYTGLWRYPLGTTQVGQDMLLQVVYSTQPVVKMMFAGALFTAVVGTVVGTVAGYKGGSVDTVLSTITDVFINIPGLPLIIVLTVLVQPSNPYVIGILLRIAAWAGLARAIRSQILSMRSAGFVEASRTVGLPTSKIIRVDVLPHMAPYVMINFVNAARAVVFSAVALYYLGLLPFSDANWGVMLNQAQEAGALYRPNLYYWVIVPMLAIIGISMGLILLSQSLDRVFNPRVRARHVRSGGAEGSGEEKPGTDKTIVGEI